MIDEKAFEIMLKRAGVKQENVGILRKFIAEYEEAKQSNKHSDTWTTLPVPRPPAPSDKEINKWHEWIADNGYKWITVGESSMECKACGGEVISKDGINGYTRCIKCGLDHYKHSGAPHRIDYGLGSTFYCHTCNTTNHCEQQSKT